MNVFEQWKLRRELEEERKRQDELSASIADKLALLRETPQQPTALCFESPDEPRTNPSTDGYDVHEMTMGQLSEREINEFLRMSRRLQTSNAPPPEEFIRVEDYLEGDE